MKEPLEETDDFERGICHMDDELWKPSYHLEQSYAEYKKRIEGFINGEDS